MVDYYSYALKMFATQSCNLKRSQCKKEKTAFDLTPEWYLERIPKGCELTGIPFEWAGCGHSLYNMSVDRIDPTLGYTQNNCVLMLRGLNGLKLNGTLEDVYKICQAVVDNKK